MNGKEPFSGRGCARKVNLVVLYPLVAAKIHPFSRGRMVYLIVIVCVYVDQ